MQDMALYLLMAVMGYFFGIRLRSKKNQLKWIDKAQTISVAVLLLFMGLRIGANDEVTSNLGSIGLYALLVTIVIMCFTLAFLSFGRRLLGFNQKGLTMEESEKEGSHQKAVAYEGPDKMTIIILICVILGMASGYLFVDKIFPDYETFSSLAGNIIRIGLCILLLFVGISLGLDGTVIYNLKSAGIKVLVLPFFTIFGTLAGAALCALILPLSIKEMLAIGAGFGWYSLAPGIIMEAGYTTASAISFMHNVLRELMAIVFIPLVAKRIGYIETTGLPGAAAMDVCLPIVERTTNSEIAVFSFISGTILTIVVPVLVPLIIF